MDEGSPDSVPPHGPERGEGEQEAEFNEQLRLATELLRGFDIRNDFVRAQGGFDTFAEVGQHVDDIRAAYDRMEDAGSRARQEFDARVSDKKALVERLRAMGENDVAERIATIFDV